MHKHEKLRKAGSFARELTAWCKDFTLLAAGCCLVALTIRVWPVIGNVNAATVKVQATASQATATLASLQKTADGLPPLELKATETLQASNEAIVNLKTQMAKLGGVADHAQILLDDFNLRLNDEVMPQVAGNLREVHGTVKQARQDFTDFDFEYLRNPWIDDVITNAAQTTRNINKLTDHGEKVVEDTQVVTDYAANKIRSVEKPKGMAKAAGVFTLGVAIKIFIQTVANVLSGR